MKNDEFRQGIPSDDRTPLPKAEPRPCMRGVLDVDLYNLTGEIVMIEPFQEYVSPINPMDAIPINPSVIRRTPRMPISKRPPKDELERALRSGMSANELAVKYKAKKITVYNWIRSYELQGIKGQGKPKDDPPPINVPPSGIDLSKVKSFCEDTTSPKNIPPIIKEAGVTDPNPAPLSALDERWLRVYDELVAIRSEDIAQVKKSFREKLRGLLAEVAGELLG